MRSIQLLDDYDVVEGTDWCRPLQITSMSGGLSDDYSFVCCYTGRPENNAKWVNVQRIFDMNELWRGSTVKQMNSINKGVCYEFVRGDIPKRNQEPLTLSEYRQSIFLPYVLDRPIERGKYKGKTWAWVKKNRNDYFVWALGEDFAPDEKDWHRKYLSEL